MVTCIFSPTDYLIQKNHSDDLKSINYASVLRQVRRMLYFSIEIPIKQAQFVQL